MTITDTTKTVYDLITPELRTGLITMVREDFWAEMTDDQGRRGVEQVAAFLSVAANTTERATPSLRVDLFWHAFVLHAKRYAEFCDALGGMHGLRPSRAAGSPPRRSLPSLPQSPLRLRGR